jgi:lipopolysaccharide transport protein LptA/LPS export ABC transporter protein LptC
MTRDVARTARLSLLALVVVVSLAVAWSLLRPATKTAEPTAAATPVPGTGTTVGGVSFLRFREASRKVELTAREMVRQQGDAMLLRGVEASLPFVMQGRPSTVTIRADECQYQPGLQRAAFKGNVHVRTEDGFELDTDSLKHWGDKERVFTRDPVRFRRGTTSGSALALEYRSGAGVQLQGQVRVRIEDAAGPATDVESETATGSREEHFVVFDGGVVVRQGGRELRAAHLRLDLDEAMEIVQKATATGEVDLRTGAGEALPGSSAVEGGAKRLRGGRLDVVFRSKGVLQEATAVDDASLEIEPGPRETPERRRIAAPRLRFDFDELGRLASVRGLPGTQKRGPRRALLTTEPLPPSKAGTRRVESDVFQAALDPVSGTVTGATFDGSVVFSEPGRKAWASASSYEDAASTLTLTGDPRIVDEGEGSELRARQIRIGTKTRALKATGNVRHSVARKESGGKPGPFGGQEPTLFLCHDLDYDPGTRTARYQVNAMVRSGTDEVRAPLITVDDPVAGGRRLKATGGTASVLHPRPAKGATKEPAAVEARSAEMLYEEAANRIVYTGDVEIRQGDILTLSPEAVVLLSKDGGDVERMLAGTPVEVHQGTRRATGERGTYTPSDETFVLVGEKVVLQDVDRRLEGRILTFEVGSDRIRVDGREEVRTEAVFRRKEPPKP